MWGNFWRVVFFIAIVAVLSTCTGCGGTLTDKELIEAVGDAGCNLKSIKRADGAIERLDCHETVRVLHER